MTRKESEEEKRLFLGLWGPISAKISLWQIRNAQQFVGQQLSWLDLSWFERSIRRLLQRRWPTFGQLDTKAVVLVPCKNFWPRALASLARACGDPTARLNRRPNCWIRSHQPDETIPIRLRIGSKWSGIAPRLPDAKFRPVQSREEYLDEYLGTPTNRKPLHPA